MTTAATPNTTTAATRDLLQAELNQAETQCQWHQATIHEAQAGIRKMTAGGFRAADLTSALNSLRAAEQELEAANRVRIAFLTALNKLNAATA